jgi:hypothetical protein
MSTELLSRAQEGQYFQSELSSLIAANASLTALCEDEKRQRLALAEQVTTLQHQLTERDQTVGDVQARLCEAQSTAERAAASVEQALSREASARAARGCADLELARLSSLVTDLEQQLTAARTLAAKPLPPPASTASSDAPVVGGVGSECDTIIIQFAHVPALRVALRQRDELQAQLEAAEQGDDFVLVGSLGEQLGALMLKVTEQPLSEEGYLALFGRHAALVQKVTEVCRELTKAKAYAEVKVLGAKLQELKALDVSALPQSWANDPVQPPARPGTAQGGEDDCANDPVYVPLQTADETTLA